MAEHAAVAFVGTVSFDGGAMRIQGVSPAAVGAVRPQFGAA